MAPQRTPEQARQGEKTGHMRYVLLISTLAAIIVLLGLYAYWA